jgi:septal ring factor EnvC (AmiA/AmiB activator)
MSTRPAPRTPAERADVSAATKKRVEAAQRDRAEHQKFEASLHDQVAQAKTPEERRAAETTLNAYLDARRARAKERAASWGGAHLVT